MSPTRWLTSLRHRPILSVALAGALGLAGALAGAPDAEAQLPDHPFGFFNQPGGGNAASGAMPLIGWALDDDGIESVDVLVDGRIVGRADYGGSRPDVAVLFPGFPDSDNAGWTFWIDTTRYLNGLHTVSALAHSETGERAFLRPLVFQFHNVTHNLKPFGRIERPLLQAELFGTCDPNDPHRRLTVVEGWALDVGVEIGDMGIGYVELMVDGAILSNSKIHCAFVPALGGLTDCYGVRRFDIENAFPLVKDAPNSGFRFVLDVGDLVAFGYAEGRHTLTVRSGDISGQVADVDEIPVVFRCAPIGAGEPAFGDVDLPVSGLFFGGIVQITGYAIDFQGVDRVEIYVDGLLVGTALYGLPRPGVAAGFPGYPDSAAAGWSFGLDTTELADSFHQIQILVVDDTGDTTLIGERTFLVQN